MYRIGWLIGLALTPLCQVSAHAQTTDTLSLRVPPLRFVGESGTGLIAGGHQSATGEVSLPVRILDCPLPRYPHAMATRGISGIVVLRFVVDTLGRAELRNLVVAEASHPGFVRSAQRAVAKCRYLPAEQDGRRVRLRVQQQIVYGQPGRDSDSSIRSGVPNELQQTPLELWEH